METFKLASEFAYWAGRLEAALEGALDGGDASRVVSSSTLAEFREWRAATEAEIKKAQG